MVSVIIFYHLTFLWFVFNVYKQTTPEIAEVTWTRGTIMGVFSRDVSDMGYQPGDEIIASLLPVVTHMQEQAY